MRRGLPAWILAYRYRGLPYRTVLSGQDPDVLVGTAPWSVAKILGAVGAAALAASVLLVLLAAVL